MHLPTHYLYIDFETTFSKTNTLKRQTLRQYLDKAEVTMLSLAVDQDPVQSFDASEIPGVLDDLRAIAESPDWCVVAHNAAFDVRVWRFKLGLPQPTHVLCSLELCCAAFPNQAGGYSLENLAKALNVGQEKIKVDLTKAKGEELRRYCERDTELCRTLTTFALARLPEEEVRCAMLTNSVRELHFDIDEGAVNGAIAAFADVADAAAQEALDVFDSAEGADAFGYQDETGAKAEWDDEGREVRVRSVRPQSIKALLLDHFGFETQSISAKKINPEKLRASDKAAKVLEKVGDANKALTFARRVKVFAGLKAVDVELGYARATATLRFSSPAPGCKGLNLHNLCVTGDTPVLTNLGWLSIVEVTKEHTVWNGTTWTTHTGVEPMGRRPVIRTLGLRMTPTHPIWTGNRMVPVGVSTPFQRALALVAGSWSLLLQRHADTFAPAVSDAGRKLIAALSACDTPPGAKPASIAECLSCTLSSLMTLCTSSTFAVTTTCSSGTEPLDTESSSTGGTGLSPSGWTRQPSSEIARNFLDGIAWILRWIVSTAPSPTDPATSASSLAPPMDATAEPLLQWVASRSSTWHENVESHICVHTISTEQAVYDLMDCGQFQAGHVLISNCKRNKKLAKILRSMYRWPEGLITTRADLMNVEYRIECLLTSCASAVEIFDANPMADPYLAFGNRATGRIWTKADPIRQLFKAAVLGLGYLMSMPRFAEELLRGLADPAFGITLADLERVVGDMKWTMPTGKDGGRARKAVTDLRCPETVVIVAYHMHRLFHEAHPEFGRTARWLEATIAACLRSLDPVATLDDCYQQPNAPQRHLIDLRFMGDAFGPGTKSFGVHCNGWPHPTVIWRDVGVRECLIYGKVGMAVTAMHARKGFRPLTKQIVLENVMQSAARCAMVEGQLMLEEEWPYQLTVHDELMLAHEQTPERTLAAREAILSVFGPRTGKLCERWSWAAIANPDEINVSKSLYEVDVGKLLPEVNGKSQPSSAWWQQLGEGNASLLESLP